MHLKKDDLSWCWWCHDAMLVGGGGDAAAENVKLSVCRSGWPFLQGGDFLLVLCSTRVHRVGVGLAGDDDSRLRVSGSPMLQMS